ncbi:MAG: hypothetical protein CM15mP106_5720 [Candidatus Neomarinimicrobiota bacterium]|nr:MAG: hypothetical protein CM15mP106_5720 [Candidatus Neomarinimicrobiota bacterium]
MHQLKIFVIILFFAKYDDKQKILDFVNKVDLVTYEFENIPYETLNEINKLKPSFTKPSVNRLTTKA